MPAYRYPIRLSREEKIEQSARAEGTTLARWLLQAARDRAKRVKKKAWACLSYPNWSLSREAESQKHYATRKFKRRTGA